jgi:hypothetical protein
VELVLRRLRVHLVDLPAEDSPLDLEALLATRLAVRRRLRRERQRESVSLSVERWSGKRSSWLRCARSVMAM